MSWKGCEIQMSTAVILFGSAIMVLAVAIIICVAVQQGKSQGLGAMTGGADADSYYSKNKKHGRDVTLSKITTVLAALIILIVVAMNVVLAAA